MGQREAVQADDVHARQVGALRFIERDARNTDILFAYEPVWAIGDKGIPATAEYADRQQAAIKRVAGTILAEAPMVLYGGIVKAGNAAELSTQTKIDGLSIGRAAWQPAGYIDILRRVAAAI